MSVYIAIKQLIRKYSPKSLYSNNSYSQSGEDRIIDFIFRTVCCNPPISYIDIGANHPYYLSNTALFYEQGGQGILVEPDPSLAKLLNKSRPRDNVQSIGISLEGTKAATFYLMAPPTLNTFSQQEALKCESMGHSLLGTIQVETIHPNQILSMMERIDLLNLDVEGLDEQIVLNIDWQQFRPKVVCIETLSYELNSQACKNQTILNHMNSVGYVLYADTYINSIFVDANLFHKYFGNR
jgi:FkbM family methyltransferase